jgi:hypothetical protein
VSNLTTMTTYKREIEMFLDDNDRRHKMGGVDDGEIYGTYVFGFVCCDRL